MEPLDHTACYQAVSRRDGRFDGRFYTGVKTTGIFCRPSCPARTPRSANVTFYSHPAAASEAGFRPCRRCRPELAPSSPEWNRRADLAGNALRLIEAGDMDRVGASGIANKLGVSERHLRRELKASLGVGPNQLAKTRRLTLARQLLDQTALPITEVAFASGFGSVRQFNDSFKAAYDATPTTLRRRKDTAPSSGDLTDVTLNLPSRGDAQWETLRSFLAARAIPGLEIADDVSFRRGVPGGQISLTKGDGGLTLRCQVDRLDRIASLVPLVRRVADLDTDLEPITEHLATDTDLAHRLSMLADLNRADLNAPRLPGAFDRFEVVIRAIVGQQVSVAGARTTLGNLVSLASVEPTEARLSASGLVPGFPTAEKIAASPLDKLGMPGRRRETLRLVAQAVASGEIDLSPGADRDQMLGKLLEVPGIGPWTAGYVAMRCLENPDGWPVGDLVLRKTLGVSPGELEKRSQSWRPWRSYAALLLWRTSKVADSTVQRKK